MKQLELSFTYSHEEVKPSFKVAKLVELWCAEPVFFASRELSETYYTEGAIGNYALCYAFGWVRSPYRLMGKATGKPTYIEDLVPLSKHGYVLPAWPVDGKVTFRFERFNALSDSYWFAMSQNRVVTARKDLPILKQTGKKPNSYRPSNFPQTGRLRMIERGNKFHTLVFGELEIPEYIRLGKFMSKVKVSVVKQFDLVNLPPGEYESKTYLSAGDLPREVNLFSFDSIIMPPVSLLKNLRFQGAAWQVGDFIVPANLQFCGGGK